ncbi:biotin carboxylase N-terminal domain-containing protein, partial [Embleya sp. NPDC056575]|uniref:biotin carboxylase N-terminal domain-containing protein n=1 Tax=Embleya sp. NPDC056575 TaxID=3345869 RepID=UPI00367CB304
MRTTTRGHFSCAAPGSLPGLRHGRGRGTECRHRRNRPVAARTSFVHRRFGRVFSRVAIVNRGEAAMRLVHAVRELAAETGTRIETVALYTDVDRTATFVR